MNDAYHWIKAFHIAAIISWMVGLLYLPRLFVYHAESQPGSEQAKTFVVMERRLMRFIMLPALIAGWLSGLTLAAEADLFHTGWLQAKLALVIFLTGLHGYFRRLAEDFASDRNRHDARFYRILNEIPTVLMLGIIALVVVKPF